MGSPSPARCFVVIWPALRVTPTKQSGGGSMKRAEDVVVLVCATATDFFVLRRRGSSDVSFHKQRSMVVGDGGECGLGGGVAGRRTPALSPLRQRERATILATHPVRDT